MFFKILTYVCVFLRPDCSQTRILGTPERLFRTESYFISLNSKIKVDQSLIIDCPLKLQIEKFMDYCEIEYFTDQIFSRSES